MNYMPESQRILYDLCDCGCGHNMPIMHGANCRMVRVIAAVGESVGRCGDGLILRFGHYVADCASAILSGEKESVEGKHAFTDASMDAMYNAFIHFYEVRRKLEEEPKP